MAAWMATRFAVSVDRCRTFDEIRFVDEDGFSPLFPVAVTQSVEFWSAVVRNALKLVEAYAPEWPKVKTDGEVIRDAALDFARQCMEAGDSGKCGEFWTDELQTAVAKRHCAHEGVLKDIACRYATIAPVDAAVQACAKTRGDIKRREAPMVRKYAIACGWLVSRLELSLSMTKSWNTMAFLATPGVELLSAKKSATHWIRQVSEVLSGFGAQIKARANLVLSLVS
jgi:hypothetical protein